MEALYITDSTSISSQIHQSYDRAKDKIIETIDICPNDHLYIRDIITEYSNILKILKQECPECLYYDNPVLEFVTNYEDDCYNYYLPNNQELESTLLNVYSTLELSDIGLVILGINDLDFMVAYVIYKFICVSTFDPHIIIIDNYIQDNVLLSVYIVLLEKRFLMDDIYFVDYDTTGDKIVPILTKVDCNNGDIYTWVKYIRDSFRLGDDQWRDFFI